MNINHVSFLFIPQRCPSSPTPKYVFSRHDSSPVPCCPERSTIPHPNRNFRFTSPPMLEAQWSCLVSTALVLDRQNSTPAPNLLLRHLQNTIIRFSTSCSPSPSPPAPNHPLPLFFLTPHHLPPPPFQSATALRYNN